jgi:hypothetical protein
MSELNDGTKIGRALVKLQMLNQLEKQLLQSTPETIKARFEKRRAELLDGLEPHIRKAVVAADTAARDQLSGVDP